MNFEMSFYHWAARMLVTQNNLKLRYYYYYCQSTYMPKNHVLTAMKSRVELQPLTHVRLGLMNDIGFEFLRIQCVCLICKQHFWTVRTSVREKSKCFINHKQCERSRVILILWLSLSSYISLFEKKAGGRIYIFSSLPWISRPIFYPGHSAYPEHKIFNNENLYLQNTNS